MIMKTTLQPLFTGDASPLTMNAVAADPNKTIKPGEIWPDDRGQRINAHGGGIIKVGDTGYWFGEYRPRDINLGQSLKLPRPCLYHRQHKALL